MTGAKLVRFAAASFPLTFVVSLMNPAIISRRNVLKTLAVGATGAVFLPRGFSAAPSDQLRLAFVGVGGWGARAPESHAGQAITAFCDVDDLSGAETYAKFPHVPKYRDIRKMLDRHADEIDAVVVTTPDHSHYPLTMRCLEAGKHVYLEKPMATTPWECRRIAAAAEQLGLSTQLGLQGHSMEGLRILKEWMDADAVGPVTEVWLWTDRTQREIAVWSETMAAEEPERESLDWRLWLADRPHRPYSSHYAPTRWRNWWGFGSGAICDIGMHMFDVVRYTLDTEWPDLVVPRVSGISEFTIPRWANVDFHFPARADHPALTVHWSNGWTGDRQNHPEGIPFLPPEVVKETKNGMAFAGPEGTLFLPDMRASRSPKIYPDSRMAEVRANQPEKVLPRVKGGHQAEWHEAIRGGRPGGANFTYGAALTEQVLLGALAERTGEAVRWDPPTMTAPGNPQATAWARPERGPDAWQPKASLGARLPD